MYLRGFILSLTAVLGCLFGMTVNGGASAHLTSPITECSNELDELNAFQAGRQRGVLGEKWSGGDNLNLKHRQCSLSGWYEGLQDFCTERAQLVAGKSGLEGLEHCLVMDTSDAVGKTEAGMDALLSFIKRTPDEQSSVCLSSQAVSTSTPFDVVNQTQEDKDFPRVEVAILMTTVAENNSDDNHDYDEICKKAKSTQSKDYKDLKASYDIGYDFAEATRKLAVASADFASIQGLRSDNEVALQAAYRELYETTKPAQQQVIKSRINKLKSQQESLKISYENAADRRRNARKEYNKKQAAYEAKRAELNRR